MPYRVEIASSARAACKGPKPCNGTKIQKDEIRFGTVVEIQGNTSFQWRHFECITPKQVANLKADLGSIAELDGYEDLPEADQERLQRLWEQGKVSDDEAMSRGHDPLDALAVGELRSLAKDREIEFKGLGKDDLVKAIRADIGGVKPQKVVHDPLDDLPAADLKDKLGALDLPKTGAKAVLVARLREALGPMTGAEDEDEGDEAKVAPNDGGRGVKSEDGDRKPASKAKNKRAGKASAAAGKRKRVKDESSAEESSAAESSAASSASSSDEEESAQSSESEEESDVKPSKQKRAGKKAAPAKKASGKAKGKSAKTAKKEADSDEEEEDVKPRSKRPQRGGRKSLAESATEEEEDVKPRVGRGGRGGKPAPKAKSPKDASSEADEPSPPQKKKRTVKSEAESDNE